MLDRQQPALVDAMDVLAALGQAQVVGDQHQGGAAAGVEFEQQVADVLAGGVVQRAGRFVGEQDARRVTNARANATRCCSPPDNWRG